MQVLLLTDSASPNATGSATCSSSASLSPGSPLRAAHSCPPSLPSAPAAGRAPARPPAVAAGRRTSRQVDGQACWMEKAAVQLAGCHLPAGPDPIPNYPPEMHLHRQSRLRAPIAGQPQPSSQGQAAPPGWRAGPLCRAPRIRRLACAPPRGHTSHVASSCGRASASKSSSLSSN